MNLLNLKFYKIENIYKKKSQISIKIYVYVYIYYIGFGHIFHLF